MTTANIITIARILLIPLFMAAALIGVEHGVFIALAIFIIASATDGVDGYVARKYNQVTNLGKFLDPLADKLLITAAILIFVQSGLMGAVSAMIILTREFAVTSLRIVAMGEGIALAANMWGKVKTVVQIIVSCFLLTPLAGITLWKINMGDAAVFAMVVITVISGIAYFKGFGKLLNGKGENK